MVDKQQINNHLVASKKRVRQARTQCINKTVQKIRKIGELLEKHPDDTKNKDKLRKTEQVLLELKKVNHVNLLRKAIIYTDNPETVITNGQSSPEEVAEALFVSHAVIKDIVSEVKEKFLLDDEANPGWKEQVTAASKKSQKNEKLENRKRKRAEKKQKTAEEKKRLDWLKENKVEATEDQEDESVSTPTTDTTLSPSKAKKKKEVDVAKSPAVSLTKSLKSSKAKIQKLVDDEYPVTKKAKFAQAISTPKVVKEKQLPLEVKSDSEQDEDQEEHFEVSEDDEVEYEEEEESESEPEEEPVEEKDEKMIDNFFTTSSGEPYQATAFVERVQPGSKNDGLVRKDRRNQLMGRPSRPQKARPQNVQSKTFGEKKQNTSEKIHPSWAAKQKLQGIDKFAGKKISFGENGEGSSSKPDEKIHPSWAAKQKQKGIGGFAGKKISFGENGEGPSSKPDEKIHPSWAAKQKQKGIGGFAGKKISFGENGEGSSTKPDEKIHPSWAAKQKQKGIGGFAGKKTSFGNDSSTKFNQNSGSANSSVKETSTKPDEKLHPSWLAKQKLKPVISSFQGKKISFDNDD